MKKIMVIKKSDSKYPKQLLEIGNPPKELYVMGNEELLYKRSIAIVGSRECTTYGMKYAAKFANELSKRKITIISGMAIGIDTASHFGALKEAGKTIAVLGSGFNYIYPEENTYLFNQILENDGCVITEFAPDTKAILSKFPYRNRIISGLSIGTLVIEAKTRSGSMVTARYTKEQEKKLFCIPSNIDLKTGSGTNKLIQGGAKLVTNVEDILCELNIKSKDETGEKLEYKKVEEEFENIYDVISKTPINVNIIAKKCNLEIEVIMQKLLIMEIKGYVKSLPGNEYVRL